MLAGGLAAAVPAYTSASNARRCDQGRKVSFSSADATVHPAEAKGQSAAAAAAAEEEIEDWRWRKLVKAPVLPRWGHTLTRVVRPNRPGLCDVLWAQPCADDELLTGLLQAEGQVFVLGGENSEECFDSGHIYKHTVGQGWSFEEVPARQGPFGHRTWCASQAHATGIAIFCLD